MWTFVDRVLTAYGQHQRWWMQAPTAPAVAVSGARVLAPAPEPMPVTAPEPMPVKAKKIVPLVVPHVRLNRPEPNILRAFKRDMACSFAPLQHMSCGCPASNTLEQSLTQAGGMVRRG